MKILVTGSNGQLGSELKKLSKSSTNFNWTFTDKEELDLSDINNLYVNISKIYPHIIINCAAYTAVDKAESEPELADLINHQAISIISNWTSLNNCKLIHISTDYVFNSSSKKPIKEDDPKLPINIYGKSKLLGEKSCLLNDKNAIILRTSWVYSVYGNNFVKTMIRLMKDNDYVKVIYDQIGSPTNAEDLASTIISIINFKYWYPGVYNYSNAGEVSWHDFATIIKEIGKFDCNIYPIKSSDFKTKASRPMYSVLDKTKIKEVYKINIPHYKDSLRKCLINFK